jgi:chromosome segregation ATPase
MNVKEAYQAVLALMLFTSCGIGSMGLAHAATDKPTMQDVKKEVAEAAEAIKHYSADQRDEAINKAKAVMDSLDAKIDKLQASIDQKWGKMDQAARRKAQAALDDLKEHRRQMAESYDALKQSSAGAWQHVKKGFSDSYADLHEAWQKAEKEFDGGQ